MKMMLRDLIDYLAGKDPDQLQNSKTKALHDLLVEYGYQPTHRYPERETVK